MIFINFENLKIKLELLDSIFGEKKSEGVSDSHVFEGMGISKDAEDHLLSAYNPTYYDHIHFLLHKDERFVELDFEDKIYGIQDIGIDIRSAIEILTEEYKILGKSYVEIIHFEQGLCESIKVGNRSKQIGYTEKASEEIFYKRESCGQMVRHLISGLEIINKEELERISNIVIKLIEQSYDSSRIIEIVRQEVSGKNVTFVEVLNYIFKEYFNSDCIIIEKGVKALKSLSGSF